jgi:hypothetical protein
MYSWCASLPLKLFPGRWSVWDFSYDGVVLQSKTDQVLHCSERRQKAGDGIINDGVFLLSVDILSGLIRLKE